MRFLTVLALCGLAASAAAADFEAAFDTPRTHVNLFDDQPAVVDANWTPRGDRFATAQVIDDGGRSAGDQWFGVGVALGIAGDPIGFGASTWFDLYLYPFLAVSARGVLAYGVITNEYKDGGDALATGVSFGAKFVMDFDDVDVSRWFRPWAALYPVGFMYVAGEEEVETTLRTGSTRDDFPYSDIFFVVQGGVGADFFLTDNFGLGVGLYLNGTLGGSRHRHDGHTIKTRGRIGVYFEYIRAAFRF
jgi:hypothetical protein